MSGYFDPAFFDPAIFDTGPTPARRISVGDKSIKPPKRPLRSSRLVARSKRGR